MVPLLERARQGECLADAQILDMHGHFGRYLQAVPDLTVEGIVKVLDNVGVHSIVVSHMQCTATDVRYGNDEVLEAMHAYPQRIMGYAVVYPTSAAEVTAEMQRCVDCGFTGLKLHSSNGFPYTEPAYAGALAIANERCMPVLLHTWGSKNDFAVLQELAPRYPGAAFLIAHAGAGNSAGGCTALARDHENVYLDTSFSAGPRGLVEELVEGAGPSRVVFGSDCYFMSLTQQIGKILGADISEEDKHTILSRNAQRILSKVKQ